MGRVEPARADAFLNITSRVSGSRWSRALGEEFHLWKQRLFTSNLGSGKVRSSILPGFRTDGVNVRCNDTILVKQIFDAPPQNLWVIETVVIDDADLATGERCNLPEYGRPRRIAVRAASSRPGCNVPLTTETVKQLHERRPPKEPAICIIDHLGQALRAIRRPASTRTATAI